MPEVFAVKLHVRPQDDREIETAFLSTLRKWLGDRWPSDDAWFEPGEPRSVGLDDGSILRWEPYNDGRSYLYEFSWRHPHSLDPEITWATQASIYHVEGGSRLSVRVSNTGPETGEPGYLLTTRPRLLLYIHEFLSASLHAGPKLALSARALDNADFQDFVRYELLDPDRRMPIMVISPPWNDSFAITPQQLCEEFMSLAEVVYAKTPQSTFALTNALGSKRLSCYNGALRVYLPQFRLEDAPTRHPLLLPRQLESASQRFQLAQKLALLTVRSYKTDDELPQLRDQRALKAEERRQALVRQLDDLRETRRTEPRVTEKEIQDWMEIAEQYEKDYSQIKLERDDLQESLREADQKIRFLQFSLNQRRIQQGEPFTSEPDFQPATAVEAVEYAMVVFEEDLLILPTAIEAAEESPYDRPADLFKALELLAAISKKKRDQGSIGSNLREALQVCGQDYRSGISENTSKQLRKQHRFEANGKEFICEEHLCFGNSYDPRECARIYFTSRDDDEPRFVIGHVGKHLDIMSTN